MKIISFKLHGKMAHFRKFYSNSTALSYYIPPVATVKGILAGLLGMERDSYYEIFSNKNCQMAIGVISPIKKTVQVMNLLKVESLNDLTGAGLNRTQTSTEWIIPDDIRNGDICYEINFIHNDYEILDKIAESVCTYQSYYLSSGISIALGSSQCLGWITDGKLIDIKENISNGESLSLNSAVPRKLIKSIEHSSFERINLMKEESITDFSNDRKIKEGSKVEVILSGSGNSIDIKLKEGSIYYCSENKNIVMIR